MSTNTAYYVDTVVIVPHHDVRAQQQKNEAARRLLQEWLTDESGYDEETWPQVKQLIEEHRLSVRSRFGD